MFDDSEARYYARKFMDSWMSALFTYQTNPKYNDIKSFLRAEGVCLMYNLVDRVSYEVSRIIELEKIKFPYVSLV